MGWGCSRAVLRRLTLAASRSTGLLCCCSGSRQTHLDTHKPETQPAETAQNTGRRHRKLHGRSRPKHVPSPPPRHRPFSRRAPACLPTPPHPSPAPNPHCPGCGSRCWGVAQSMSHRRLVNGHLPSLPRNLLGGAPRTTTRRHAPPCDLRRSPAFTVLCHSKPTVHPAAACS